MAAGLRHVLNVPELGELARSRRNRTVPMDPATQAALSQLRAQAARRDGDRLQHAHMFARQYAAGRMR